jgi:hypothetical protein
MTNYSISEDETIRGRKRFPTSLDNVDINEITQMKDYDDEPKRRWWLYSIMVLLTLIILLF